LEFVEHELTEGEVELNKNVQDTIVQYRLEDGRFPPGVISDVDIARRYATYCQQRGIAIRFLLCATDSPCPIMDAEQVEPLLQVATFLGYDYILNECEFSGLYDDLTPPPPELSEFSRRLNQYGLFDNLGDLEEYVSARWSFLRRTGERFVETDHGVVRTTELEDDKSFWKCGVWEIPWPGGMVR